MGLSTLNPSRRRSSYQPNAKFRKETNDHPVAAPTAKRLPHVVLKKHRGAYSELIASAWLLEKGYEVFRNLSDRGPIDLIAVKGDKCLFVDVKTVLVRLGKKGKISIARRSQRLTEKQVELGVRALFVTPDGLCDWHIQRLDDIYNSVFQAPEK